MITRETPLPELSITAIKSRILDKTNHVLELSRTACEAKKRYEEATAFVAFNKHELAYWEGLAKAVMSNMVAECRHRVTDAIASGVPTDKPLGFDTNFGLYMMLSNVRHEDEAKDIVDLVPLWFTSESQKE